MSTYYKTDKENHFIEAEVYYDKGGMNYFTGRTERRGYYMSAMPIERSRGMTSFTAFTGRKQLLMEVPRKSKKAEAEAQKMFEAQKLPFAMAIANMNNINMTGEEA